MDLKFSAHLNPHYPFDNSVYQREIARQEKLSGRDALVAMMPYQSGGGSITPSPWGSNQSVDAGIADTHTLQNYLHRYDLIFSKLINSDLQVERAEPIEFCVKDLMINPGCQLSLQRHQGREEFWIVKRGQLTVIVDGKKINISEGEAIFIPMGATHCMNNCTNEPIEVQELQLGICREDDNIRILDATRDEQGNPKPRPTYPITNDIQFQSAILFAELAIETAKKNNLPNHPLLEKFIKE